MRRQSVPKLDRKPCISTVYGFSFTISGRSACVTEVPILGCVTGKRNRTMTDVLEFAQDAIEGSEMSVASVRAASRTVSGEVGPNMSGTS
jgi:hypothetical protein